MYADINTRHAYMKQWNRNHPDNVRINKLRYWENRAKKHYGAAYIPPEDGEELSQQARELRKLYYKKYRIDHHEAIKASIEKYWQKQEANKGK